MTAVAHFMHHVYGPFDAPFEPDRADGSRSGSLPVG